MTLRKISEKEKILEKLAVVEKSQTFIVYLEIKSANLLCSSRRYCLFYRVKK